MGRSPGGGASVIACRLVHACEVKVAVFDATGRVATLAAGREAAGDHTVKWSGTGEDGRRVQAGT